MPTAMERQLGEMLVKDSVISPHDLDEALRRQEESNASLGRVLIEMGLASEWEMAAALGKQLNVPFITLSHYDIDRQVLEAIPEDIVKKYRIVPVDKTGDTLTIALSDPSNIYLLDELRILTQCQIIPVISFESDIVEAITRYYGGDNGSNLDEMLKEISDSDVQAVADQIEAETLIESPEDEQNIEDRVEMNDAPVIQLVNLIITEAVKASASDIHIEPYEKTLRLRYRIDGFLQEMTPPPKQFQNAIISRIKILSELDIAEKRLPQDGRFRVKYNNRAIDFRVATCPTIHGEKVVIRILDQSSLMLDLTDLGFEADALEKFESQIRKPWGMILVTGPTGSGKSTTLYSALSTINDPRKNIQTIEDPVEYKLLGINQVHARPDIGLNFAAALRSFLRQDPDIIMIGEVRDLETAEIAIKAALTGHLVLSTLHTNDAPSTVQRLINMGVESFLVTASLNLVQAQRLVRRTCTNCRVEYRASDELVQALRLENPDTILYRGDGCERCRQTGYKGRVGLYEVMVITDEMRDAVLNGISAQHLKRMAMDNSMETLRGAGIRKILQGVTTVEEVLSATMADES
jgi:type IV pilus assembly protein PilB